MSSCKTCDSWGRTVTELEYPQAVPCPACKRLTWPNLGVNLPAGAAVAMSSASIVKAVEDVAGDTGKVPHPLAVYAFAKMRQAAARRGKKK